MTHDNDNMPADMSDQQPSDLSMAIAAHRAIRATRYRWPDPTKLPRRQWMLGEWLLAGEVTAIIAPGGTGKSTLSTGIALSLASGRPLVGKQPKVERAVWMFNLEDSIEEMEKQVAAACIHHQIGEAECANRIHLNSGLDMALCVASDEDGRPQINEEVFMQLEATIREHQIGAVIIDPLISSHRLTESSNEGIDLMVKRWKRLAYETGCAVVLVHHTKKLGGRDANAEDGRGAIALRDAARVVLVLNKMSASAADECGITDAKMRNSIVRVEMGKASRSVSGGDEWFRLVGELIGNGDEAAGEESDSVAVAIAFVRPDPLDQVSVGHLQLVQGRLLERDWRKDPQAKENWIGILVAGVVGLDVGKDKSRISKILKSWYHSGALAFEQREIKGKEVSCVVVGNAVKYSEMNMEARRLLAKTS